MAHLTTLRKENVAEARLGLWFTAIHEMIDEIEIYSGYIRLASITSVIIDIKEQLIVAFETGTR